MNHEATQLEIPAMLTAFGSAVNMGKGILRYDWSVEPPKPTQRIVPLFRYSKKPRQLSEATTPSGTPVYPFITYATTSITHANERNTNKLSSVFDSQRWIGEDGIPYIRKPVPINLNISLYIGAQKKSDLEAILVHYVSVLNPTFDVSWRDPFSGHEIRSRVVWSGDAPMNYSTDLQSGDNDDYSSELSFTMEGWIFRDTIDKAYPIKKADINFIADNDYNCRNFYAEEEKREDVLLDTMRLESKVNIKRILPNCAQAGDEVFVFGNNISQIEGIYLMNNSGDEIPVESYEPFCFSEEFKDSCPPFEGYMVEEFEIYDNNTISITIPEDLNSYNGVYDIRVTNRWSGCVEIDKDKHTKHNNLSLGEV